MVPNAEFPPVTPFTLQVTEMFEALVTVAVNCLVVLKRRLALAGEMLTTIGSGFTTVTDALPTAAGVTALLLACTMTVTGDAGAV